MLIKVKVHADSGRGEIIRKGPEAYEVWVKAPARDGRANIEALGALAAAMGIRAAQLHIVKGATSPNKIVKLMGII